MVSIKIDFTLVVQAINFGIGYLIIRKLLLAPAVEAIEADSLHKRTLNHSIETATLANSAADERMKKQWQEFRQEVQEKIPQLPPQQTTIDYSVQEIIVEKIDEEYAKYLVNAVTKDIVERVENVHS